MLTYIILLPGIIAFVVASRRSVGYAFLRVYVPTVLLLPDYYRAITPGLPDPTFSQSVCVALALRYAMAGFPGYRFSPNDLWVVGYALCVSFSEYRASGYSDAQNLMFGMLFGVVFPYIFAKSLIEPLGNRFVFAKICVLAFAFVAVLSSLETRMGLNLWHLLLDRFFPGQGESWGTTFRFGLARAAGPYAHALLAGMMMIVAFRLQRWLEWSNAWPRQLRQLPWLPMTPARLLTLATAGGLFLTLAKGSWLASFLGAALSAVGRAKNNRLLAMCLILGALVVGGIPATLNFISYASVGRANAGDDNQETAAYRYELITNYMDIANEKPNFGWGVTKWPAIPGSASIDNHYLLLLLMHGRWAFSFFLMLLVGTMVRLVIYGLRQAPTGPPGSALSFTLAGINLAFIVAIGTVFMGQQTIPMFFMLSGWAESYMMRRTREWGEQAGTAATTRDDRAFRFRRVL